jgi:hypothetical protein
VEPKLLFMRSGVIKSQIKSHQAIHDGMFSFIQLCILPQTQPQERRRASDVQNWTLLTANACYGGDTESTGQPVGCVRQELE